MKKTFFHSLLFLVISLAAVYFVPWRGVKWGQIQLAPAQTITVTGFAQQKQANEVASYTVGVRASHENKNQAVAEVNEKINTIIEQLKQFGIEDEDLKTQNLSIYRQDERKDEAEKWWVSNNINVTLRDIDRVESLTNLLSETVATNVNGPNLRLDETQDHDTELMGDAIADARKKAEKMAAASSKKLGEVVNISEGGVANSPILFRAETMGMGGGGAPIEPGTSTVSKSVTVVFELK